MNQNVSVATFDDALSNQSVLGYNAVGSNALALDPVSNVQEPSLSSSDSLESNILIFEMLKVDIKNYIMQRDGLSD